ncbi:centrosomal protein of 295 kDa isoform X1 [Erpetoichthys calabaricus]|uniref:centrosomal protein of 295 kDa isoform X1 n=2 Tax=Erpetoichthys calabaricus TaxID=27687 RepID=UPI00109FC599|nr:centrosomal protein of 295 kDa isoform X1 [Erpetoichthys calabaricus]
MTEYVILKKQKMKRKIAKMKRLRLSPNEEAQLLKEEFDRRRKLRLQQVREQERYISYKLRKEVQQRRSDEHNNLAEQLKVEWQKEQADKTKTLEAVYHNSMKSIGEGHRNAKENEPDWAAIAQKVAENKQKAEERHREALKELKFQRGRRLEDETRHIQARQKALMLEKERALKIASLPPVLPDPIECLDLQKHPHVKLYDADSYSFSYHHLPEICVDRENNGGQLNACEAAAVEGKRIDELQKEEEQERKEQIEKARLRGCHALHVVHLQQDKERLMKELEQLQQADLARRRRKVASMPPQLFEPPYRRQEIKKDWQRQLEFAFEDMYTGEKKVKGDVLCLNPEPLPEPSIGTQDEELNLTLEPEAAAGSMEDFVEIPELEQPGPVVAKQSLQNLISRIRTQRQQWISRRETERCSNAVTTESGSVSNEGQIAPQEDVKEVDDQVVCSEENKMSSEEPVIAGSSSLLHPNEQAFKIQSALERRKQEEELELKKQEQETLLAQLEEQKRILELRLKEAQVEKDQIQAQMKKDQEKAISIENAYKQQVYPATDEHFLDVVATDSEHLQMIRQYQQRCLEQNRRHKQCVDEAQKRLNDYRMMLMKRYPQMSTSLSKPCSSGTTVSCYTPVTQAEVLREDESHLSLAKQVDQQEGKLLAHNPSTLQMECQEKKFPPYGASKNNNLPKTCAGGSSEINEGSIYSYVKTSFQLAEPQGEQQSDNYNLKHESLKNMPVDMEEVKLHSEREMLEHDVPGTEPSFSKSLVPAVHERGVVLSLEEIHAKHRRLCELQEKLNRQQEAILQRQKSQSKQLSEKLNEPERGTQRQDIPKEEQTSKEQEPIMNNSKISKLNPSCFGKGAELQASKSSLHESSAKDQDRMSLLSSLTGGIVDSFHHDKEYHNRPIKPPLAKHRLGTLASISQHELSAIPEVETPVSDSLAIGDSSECNSSASGSDGVDNSVSSQVDTAMFSSTHRETSCASRHLTWRERLELESSLSSDLTLPSLVSTDLPSYSADVGRGVVRYPGRLTSQSTADIQQTGELVLPQVSSLHDEDCCSTTLSTGSCSPLSEELGATATGSSLHSVLADDTKSYLTPFYPTSAGHFESLQQFSPLSTDVPARFDSCLIQNLINKYTKVLSRTLEDGSFHGLPAALDTSGLANSSANHPYLVPDLDSSQNFQPLRPVLDFEVEVNLSPRAQRLSAYCGGTVKEQGNLELKFLTASHGEVEKSSLTSSPGSSLSREYNPATVPVSATPTEVSSDETTAPQSVKNFKGTQPVIDISVASSPQPVTHSLGGSGYNTGGRNYLQKKIFDSGKLLLTQSGKDHFKLVDSPLVNFQDEKSSALPVAHDSFEFGIGKFHSTLLSSKLDSSQHFPPLHSSLDLDLLTTISSPHSELQCQTCNHSNSEKAPSISVSEHLLNSTVKNGEVGAVPASFALEVQEDTRPAVNNTDDGASCGLLSENLYPLQINSCSSEETLPVSLPSSLSCVTTTTTTTDSSQHNGDILVSCTSDTAIQSTVRDECLQCEEESLQLSETSVEQMRSESVENLPEIQESFYQLDATHSAVCGSDLIETNCTDLPCSPKIPVTAWNTSQEIARLESFPRSTILESISMPKERSIIPIWETDSGAGILEEPELTLVSLDETILLEQNSLQAENAKDNGSIPGNLSKGSRLVHSPKETSADLPAEIKDSAHTVSEAVTSLSSTNEKTSSAEVRFLNSHSSSMNLQEMFQQKKAATLRRSAQRVQAIKNKDRPSKPPNVIKDVHSQREGQVQCTAVKQVELGKFTKVGEVKVNTPEQRKAAEAEMYERTERLYNQLCEVKQKRDMKMRQEAYAKNRQKAKEFQKKILQKCRNKQNHS